MNLFTHTLADYLINEWQRGMASVDSEKKLIFIVDSLDPINALTLFALLEKQRLHTLSQQNLVCHFRIAKNLWLAWCEREGEAYLRKLMAAIGGIDHQGKLIWVDMDDRLTKWRSEPKSNDVDGLIIVLLGFNHASDQGGLADFHRVDEARVWNELGQSFIPWLQQLSDDLSLEASQQAIDYFDAILQQLFKVRPRLLVKLSQFFEHFIYGQAAAYDDFKGVVEQFFRSLPFWDLPPLLNVKDNKKHAQIIKEADTFISHQRFKSAYEQKKAWVKLEKAFEETEFELPETLSSGLLYEDLAAFRETLHDFIFKADALARAKLMQTDLLPILEILKMRVTAKKERDKLFRLSGFSLEVLLQVVWYCLLDFEEQISGRPLADVLQAIHIELTAFKHDLDGESAAKTLLAGCLGGLPEWLEDIDLQLPVDEEQVSALRSEWSARIPLNLTIDNVTYGTSRARPHLVFKITLETTETFDTVKPSIFHWSFGPTHPERVRFSCAQEMLHAWQRCQTNHTDAILPAFKIPLVNMTALYFAADEEEANRLVSQVLCETRLFNLVEDIDRKTVDTLLWDELRTLSIAYSNWLHYVVENGYYAAMQQHFNVLQRAYESLASGVLNKQLAGSDTLLRRFYKAFLLIADSSKPNDAFLSSAIVWGISPPVLELTHAQARFLCDSFPEIIREHLLHKRGKSAFNRLLNLIEIHRPLAGLVINEQKTLSAKIKSFGLLHYLGEPPSTEKSLAVQTLLREEENDDDDIADLVKPTEESEVVVKVLNNYLQLYPFAEDGIRVLALHVEELAIILSGVDRFLHTYLQLSSKEWPAFHCELMVYSTSSSPLSVESHLSAWRNHIMETYREQGRALILSVGHHFAPTRKDMEKLLNAELRLYDVAFLFRFLSGELSGEAEATLPFEYDFNTHNISPFPICEYPRPIQKGDQFRRESLLSNRRLRIQTHHADLSARLRHSQNPESEHLIFGQIDYQPWQNVVEKMHSKAQWVACIDPFIDKHLLASSDLNGQRKVVGFTSGLGAYGELNLSISTEQDTLTQLTQMVKNHLICLLPFQSADHFETMAAKIIYEAEEIIGLSSLRAVVGQGEKIREVIGFAAVRRALALPEAAVMTQLLPIDAFQHWFVGSEVTYRPDLLQLSFILREDDIPLVQAVLIECKFAQQNSVHIEKAYEQLKDGLSHLTQLFVPNRSDLRTVMFDRRYWWAQLQRSITSRSMINLSEQQRKRLAAALEQLTEGYYEMHWQGAIFTFWTDDPGEKIKTENISLSSDVVSSPLLVPPNFLIRHISMGYKALQQLFYIQQAFDLISFLSHPISIRPEEVNLSKTAVVTEIDAKIVPEPVNRTFDTLKSVDMPSQVAQVIVEQPIQQDTNVPLPERSVEPEIVNHHPNDAITPVIEFTYRIPEKILIGKKSNGEAVYWHYGHSGLANRHMLLFGASGSGKTYGIQCLLAEIAKQNAHSLIIDYTDGFLPKQVEECFKAMTHPQDHFVITDKLPLNPFRRQLQELDPSRPLIEENAYQVASRITSIFTSVFNTMGDQQSSSLVRILEAGIEEDIGFSLAGVLERLRADGTHGETLANKLEPFIKAEPFRTGTDSAWDSMLTSPSHWVHILQLKGLSKDIQKLVTEFALWDLWDYACNTGSKNRPIPVVLDEIQNLDHRSDSPIDKMLREGRKFGLSLILATQTTSQFDQEERDRLFQAGHKLFFKPANTEITRFAELLSVATGITKGEWGERLAKLQKGQCWSLGATISSNGTLREKAELVSITSLEERLKS